MGKLGYAKKGRGEVTFIKEITAAGTAEPIVAKIVATTIAFVKGTPDTITDSDSKFLLKGFKAGDVIRVAGSVDNDGVHTIASVTAGTITLDSSDALVDGVATPSVTIDIEKKVLVKSVNIQALKGNTSAYVCIGSSEIVYADEKGYMCAKANSKTYEGVYLDEIYVDVGTSGDKVAVTYEEVL